jgi:LCP family protein required for cell wall assembly
MTDRPDYKVYRSRPRLLPGRDDEGPALEELRGRDRGGAPPGRDGRRRLRDRLRTPRVTPARFAAGFLLGIVLWLGLAAMAFIASSLTADHVSDAAENALDAGGSGLTAPVNTLVLGSDRRPAGSKEPGASTMSERADTIMLLRSGGGASARLSIPRDTLVDIPGHGLSRINASYAFGGAALTILTVKQYLGIEIHHVVEVNLENFPRLVDAMGGIDYTGGCVVSLINGGNRNGGYTLRLPRGTTHIDGDQALALARTRKNLCRPNEDDRARVRRQQQILSAMKSRAVSPAGFARAPWIAWQTPRAIRTDMSGVNLVGFMTGLALGGEAQTRVLAGTPTGDGSLTVSDADRQAAVRRFLAD